MKQIHYIALFALIVLASSSASIHGSRSTGSSPSKRQPIVESEVAGRLSRLQQRKNVPRNRLAYERSRLLLDRFIEDSIVLQEAEHPSIVVSDEKVTITLKKLMAE